MIKLKFNSTEKIDHIFLSPITFYLLALIRCIVIFKNSKINDFDFLFFSVLQGNISEHIWSLVDENFFVEETKKKKKYEKMKIQIATFLPKCYLDVFDGKIEVVNNECILNMSKSQFDIIESTLNHFFLPLFNERVNYERVLEIKNDHFI